METDELFDGEDDAEKRENVSDTGDYTGVQDSSDCVTSIQTDNPDDVNGGTITDVSRVHRSYLNLYNASRDQNGSDDSNRMPSVRLMDPYDDDDWDPENIFPYGEDLSSVWGGKGCRPRLLEDIPKSLTVQQQDVVPVDLLEHYTSMCEPMKNQAIDNALTGFCAYNLPAVVLTLGPQNWSILRECYESLACSMQWKIRYTLASSLHEIARVIGPELAERDLVPFFNALVKDVDEVRVGLLRNLASFVKILGTVERRKCLECLRSFLETDNKRNWRFRLELTRQLEQLTEIYEADEVYKYLRPLAVDLVKDGVAEVRKTALFVITNLILRVRSTLGCGKPNLVHDFLRELVETLCQSEKWVRRQTFAALSGQLIGVGALKPVQFAEDVLPHLVNLSYDPVPNVRLIVAQTMVSCVSKLEFDERCNQLVTNIIETLQFDTDRDVRYFSSLYEAQKG
jgi:serine/threonine-protein phosphatase 4 regulatory subunit 1